MTVTDDVYAALQDYAQQHQNDVLLHKIAHHRIHSHANACDALAAFLSERLMADGMLLSDMYALFQQYLPCVWQVIASDLEAIVQRDAACQHRAEAFLFYKGFHAIEAARVAMLLWQNNARGTARWLQSRIAEVFNVDIHPAAVLGHSLMLDHATGLVVGETATVGNNCSILHGVTLGGNGRDSGDRHPKIGHHVLIGAGATILGNITIGDYARVAAGSVVLDTVAAGTTVAGIPARVVKQHQSTSVTDNMNHIFTTDSHI